MIKSNWGTVPANKRKCIFGKKQLRATITVVTSSALLHSNHLFISCIPHAYDRKRHGKTCKTVSYIIKHNTVMLLSPWIHQTVIYWSFPDGSRNDNFVLKESSRPFWHWSIVSDDCESKIRYSRPENQWNSSHKKQLCWLICRWNTKKHGEMYLWCSDADCLKTYGSHSSPEADG